MREHYETPQLDSILMDPKSDSVRKRYITSLEIADDLFRNLIHAGFDKQLAKDVKIILNNREEDRALKMSAKDAI